MDRAQAKKVRRRTRENGSMASRKTRRGPLLTSVRRKAAEALLKWLGGEKEKRNNLLEGDEGELLYLVVSLKKPPNFKKDKPQRLQVPHPVHQYDGAEICLIVKDHKGEGHKQAKEKVAKFERKAGITKVLGVSKLKTKYESHEAKRQLCNTYDLFLADDRVIRVLPSLLGKSFFKKKKQPIPVRLAAGKWDLAIKKACQGTYVFWSGGNCLNIKIARSNHTAEEVAENIMAGVEKLAKILPGKMNDIQSLYLKSVESVSLPLYSVVPEAKN